MNRNAHATLVIWPAPNLSRLLPFSWWKHIHVKTFHLPTKVMEPFWIWRFPKTPLVLKGIFSFQNCFTLSCWFPRTRILRARVLCFKRIWTHLHPKRGISQVSRSEPEVALPGLSCCSFPRDQKRKTPLSTFSCRTLMTRRNTSRYSFRNI